MSEPILHHYDLSPFAHKIRLAFGLKGLAWRSVEAPMVMPKPDLVELTGGYRRVPVLQLGADIYCDTHCIAGTLDRLHPEPPLSPPGRETLAHALSRWGETTFMMGVMVLFGIGDVFDEAFVEDRKKTMIPPGMDLDHAKIVLPTKLLQIRANLDRLESLLSDGRPFLLGESATIADLSAFHPLMLLFTNEKTRGLLESLKQVPGWAERVGAIGPGDRSELDAVEAIAIARDAEPLPFEGEPVLPEGMEIGTPVVIVHDDYGSGNVAGTLAASGLHEIAVRRRTERAGDVVVHFPRADYSAISTG